MTTNRLLELLAASLPDPAAEREREAQEEEWRLGFARGCAKRILGEDFAAGLEWMPDEVLEDGAAWQAHADIEGTRAFLLYTADEDGDEGLEVLSYCGQCSHTRRARVAGLAQLAELLREWGVLR